MQEFLYALRESGELIVGAEPPAKLDAELERALASTTPSFATSSLRTRPSLPSTRPIGAPRSYINRVSC